MQSSYTHFEDLGIKVYILLSLLNSCKKLLYLKIQTLKLYYYIIYSICITTINSILTGKINIILILFIKYY